METSLEKLFEAAGEPDDLASLTRLMLELLEAITGLESIYLTAIDEKAAPTRMTSPLAGAIPTRPVRSASRPI